MLVEEPRLLDLIGLEDLRALLADAARVSGAPVRVLDTTGSEPLEVGDAQRLPRLCQMIHTSAAGDGFCRRCVLRAAFQAAGQGGQRAYQCRAGLTLTAAAIRAGDIYLGTLVLGPALCATLPPESADEWATETGLPCHDLRTAGQELPLASENLCEKGQGGAGWRRSMIWIMAT